MANFISKGRFLWSTVLSLSQPGSQDLWDFGNKVIPISPNHDFIVSILVIRIRFFRHFAGTTITKVWKSRLENGEDWNRKRIVTKESWIFSLYHALKWKGTNCHVVNTDTLERSIANQTEMFKVTIWRQKSSWKTGSRRINRTLHMRNFKSWLVKLLLKRRQHCVNRHNRW